MKTQKERLIKVKLPAMEIEVNEKYWKEFARLTESNPAIIAEWVEWNFYSFLGNAFKHDPAFGMWVREETEAALTRIKKKKSR